MTLTDRKQFITTLAIVLGAVVVLAAIVFHLWLDAAMKRAIEQVGSRITQGTVALEHVHVSLLHSQVRIEGLTVATSQGFKAPTQVAIRKVEAQFDWTTIFSDPLVVKDIAIDGVEVTYEGLLNLNNLADIEEKIKRSVMRGSAAKGRSPARVPGEEPRRQVFIRKFTVLNGRATWNAGDQRTTATLPDVTLHDVTGQAEGAGIPQIAGAIVSAIVW
ncbi:MAG: DUF748 domain-containing protein [Nitrospiraceae bacterium]